jgi:hypothetical protein
MSQIEGNAEQESGLSDPRICMVRWTFCAMLFFATSINYVDRQVLCSSPRYLYLLALVIVHPLAPRLKKVEFSS